MRQQPAPPTLQPGAPQTIVPQAPAEQPAIDDAGPTVLVKGFRITGATLIPEAELLAQIEGAIGQELTLEQLRALALQLTGYYIQKGYLARAHLPPQEVQDGIITIEIIEGKRGNIDIDEQSERINTARVQGFVDHRLAQGEAMSLIKLGEGLAILNEQPGVDASAGIRPGASEGDIDVVVTIQDKPLANYNASFNNNGSRSTGVPQANGSVVFNNPFGLFDAASLLVNVSQGTRYARGEYAIAVGESGLRAGANASYMKYNVTQKSLSALDSHGMAATLGLIASYPLTRRTDFSLSVNGGIDHKILRDYTSAGETGDRKVNVMNAGVSGTSTDAFLGGGKNGFGLTLTAGKADLSGNADALASDLATRKTDGGFAKAGFQLSRLQPLSEAWMVSASLSGQLSAVNLDSTEQFSLGGPSGVRGYPAGEASGDDGWLGSVNFVHSFSKTLSAGPFVDVGGVRVNHNAYDGWKSGNARLSNTYMLKSGGVSANWAVAENWTINATLAAPIGANPGRDTDGKDGDGRSLNMRGWFGVTAQF